MDIVVPIVLLLGAAAAWTVPGFVLSRWLLPGACALERAATSLLLGIVTVAPTAFLLVLIRARPETPAMVAVASTAWSTLGLVLQWKWPRKVAAKAAFGKAVAPYLVLSCFVASGALAVSTTLYKMETTYMWWHCPHLSVLYLMEDGSGGGVAAWDPDWQREVRHLFSHPTSPGFGLKPVLKLQRPGNAAFLATPMVFMSNAGLVAALWATDFLLLSFALLLLARRGLPPILAAGLAGIFWLGVRVMAGYQVNENGIALAVSMGLLHLLLREPREKRSIAVAVAAGVVCGHLIGIRLITALMIPGVLVLFGGALKRQAALAATTVAAAIPWMWAHGATYGDPFKHPAFDAIQPTQRVLEGTVFETSFYPLNFPLASRLVTGPDHPFPSMLTLPLEMIQSFGAPLLALALLGLLTIRAERRLVTGLLLWSLPIPLCMMLIVQLDYQKLSMALCACGAIPLLAGCALSEFQGGIRYRAGVAAALVLLLAVGPRLVRNLELPIDERMHASYVNHDGGIPERKTEQDAFAEFDWSTERARLGTSRVLPTGLRDFDPLWGSPRTGFNVLRNARVAQVAADGAAIDTPIIIWAGLRPAPLDHNFVARTVSAPVLPPGGLANLELSGATLYFVKLTAPAATEATVRLTRIQNAMHLHVTPGSDTVAGPRFVSFIVVDPSKEAAGAPELSIDTERRSLYNVTSWSLPNLDVDPQGNMGFKSQPRVISNVQWSLKLGGGGARVELGAAEPTDLTGYRVICRSRRKRLLKRCDAPEEKATGPSAGACHYALVGPRGILHAVRSLTPVDAIIAAGAGFPAPGLSDRCSRMLMSGDLATRVVP